MEEILERTTAVVVTKLAIPPELRGRIPSGFLTAARLRLAVNCFCFCLACVCLSNYRNGWTYFVGAFVSPFLTAIYFVIFPFNPYRTPAAKFSEMYNKDEEDVTCKLFADLIRARSARRVLLTNALVLSLSLVLAMAAISEFQARPISWVLDRDSGAWVPLLTLSSSLVLFPIFINALIVWSLKNWSAQRS